MNMTYAIIDKANDIYLFIAHFIKRQLIWLD